ncbi:hypothetical protein [Amycolatopsis sp. NPDC051061]|uniref:hypothetical protein n=1 Tax=Amycolatopsis sp. NPDC051061 TaxID=3155042 RepID=UPI003421393E
MTVTAPRGKGASRVVQQTRPVWAGPIDSGFGDPSASASRFDVVLDSEGACMGHCAGLAREHREPPGPTVKTAQTTLPLRRHAAAVFQPEVHGAGTVGVEDRVVDEFGRDLGGVELGIREAPFLTGSLDEPPGVRGAGDDGGKQGALHLEDQSA